jgi:hypothetical protein
VFHNSPDRVAVQMWIEESGAIQYLYLPPSTGVNDATRGGSASIGVENASGTEAISYSVNSPTLPAFPYSIRLECSD